MKTKYFLFLILISLSFLSCEEAPQPNEPFYCKINGKRWRPNSGTALYGTKLYAELTNSKTIFSIIARDFQTGERIFIVIRDVNKISSGIYKLSDLASKTYIGYTPNYYAEKPEEFYSYDNKGEIEILFSNGRVSGTFDSDVKSESTGRTKRITKGQFNLSYNEY